MTGLSAKDRRAQLRRRQQEEVQNRDKKGGARRRPLFDFSSVDRDVKWFEPKKDEQYVLDIIPYVVGTKHPDQKIKPGELDYKLEFGVHRNVGPSRDMCICRLVTWGKRCPICEDRAEIYAKAGNDKAILAQAKVLKPSIRTLFNLLVVGGESEDMLLWEVSFELFEKELLDHLNRVQKTKGEMNIFDYEEGMSTRFWTVEDSFDGGSAFLRYKSFDFLPREPYEDSICKEALQLDMLLIEPSYDEVQRLHLGLDDEDTGDKGEIQQQTRQEPAGESSGSGRRRTPRPSQHSSPEGPQLSDEQLKSQVGQPGQRKAVEQEKAATQPKQESKGRTRRPAESVKHETSDVPDPDERCLSGHRYGVDSDQKDTCLQCPEDLWGACMDEKDKRQKEAR